MGERLLIRGLSTISPLGTTIDEVRQTFQDGRCRAVPFLGRRNRPVFPLTVRGEEAVRSVSACERYGRLDRVTLLALASAHETLESANVDVSRIGCVSIGSSRGATSSLEGAVANFISDPSRVPSDTSPITTAGNISSWVAQEVLSKASRRGRSPRLASLGTSMTCSSAFHALLICFSFLRAKLADIALFGGSEASLTAFTVSHLEALRIYSDGCGAWPCRPLGAPDENTSGVALGEGVGTALLIREDSSVLPTDMELLGLGWAIEEIPSPTGVSVEGSAFEQSMMMALNSLPPGTKVDTAILHAPGSAKGDAAELAAVERVLGKPMLCSTKHLSGHTYGASGMISLALAQTLLTGFRWPGFPYPTSLETRVTERAEVVLINTAGFGGNAVTVIVGSPSRG